MKNAPSGDGMLCFLDSNAKDEKSFVGDHSLPVLLVPKGGYRETLCIMSRKGRKMWPQNERCCELLREKDREATASCYSVVRIGI